MGDQPAQGIRQAAFAATGRAGEEHKLTLADIEVDIL
jgi:hypothetical protein